MNERNITIPAGGMYQEWSCLMDLVEEDMAKTLEQLANTKGWREVQACEAKDMGFGELAEWPCVSAQERPNNELSQYVKKETQDRTCGCRPALQRDAAP